MRSRDQIFVALSLAGSTIACGVGALPPRIGPDVMDGAAAADATLVTAVDGAGPGGGGVDAALVSPDAPTTFDLPVDLVTPDLAPAIDQASPADARQDLFSPDVPTTFDLPVDLGTPDLPVAIDQVSPADVPVRFDALVPDVANPPLEVADSAPDAPAQADGSAGGTGGVPGTGGAGGTGGATGTGGTTDTGGIPGTGGTAGPGSGGAGVDAGACSSGVVNATLVNGGFEQPALSSPTFYNIPVGSEPAGFGWTVSTADIDVHRVGWGTTSLGYITGPAVDGSQYLDLVGSGSSGGVRQSVTVVAGQTYELALFYANNPAAGPNPSARVTVVGCAGTLLSNALSHGTSTAANLDWTNFTATFIVDGDSVSIQLDSTAATGAGGILVDHVSLMPVSGGPIGYRYVRFLALTSIPNDSLTSMSEFELLDAQGKSMPRTAWVVSTDSQELQDQYSPVSAAVDGDPATFWQTEWGAYVAPLPHNLTIDLGSPQVLSGFIYTPRQDWYNGRIGAWELYLSNDPNDWGTPIVNGDFPDTITAQKRTFLSPGTLRPTGSTGHRWARFLALTSLPNDSLTSMSEFELLDGQGNSLPRSGWTLFTDSEELSASHVPVYNTIDGDTGTMWQTEWGNYVAPLPHNLTIDMGIPQVVSGFIYTPRQDWYNGRIGAWEFYLSHDPSNWGAPVATGNFPDTNLAQTRTFTPQ